MQNIDNTHHIVNPRLFARYLAVCLTLVGASVHGQDAPPAPAPKIEFEQVRHDFGRVRSGEVMKHDFKFTNTGNADLVISNVLPSCGCATLTDYTRVIPPGGKGSLPLEFNSNGLQGPVQKTLLVQSNDPVQPSLVLFINGVFWKPVELYPTVALMYMPPHTDQKMSTTVRIVNQMEELMKLQQPVSNVPQLRARLEESTPGKEFNLIVDTVPPFDHKDIQGTITLETSSSETPKIEVLVIVIAQPEITVTPSQMYLPAVPPDVPEPYVINIHNQSSDVITLNDAACDAPGSKVEIKETAPGRDFELAVTFPPDFGYVPDKSYSITAHTSLASHPIITIQVFFAQPR